MLTTIVVFIIFLGILIFVHELGHFLMAKKADIRVQEFALGFGPKLISKQKGETLFSIRAIPLGGFCNMVGEMPVDEDELSEEEAKIQRETVAEGRAFYQKSAGKRLLVLAMGAIMNFVLALVAFMLIFGIYGLPVDYAPEPIIGQAFPNQPAASAGLESGDEVLSINGQAMDSWDEMSSYISERSGETLTITVERDSTEMEFEVTPEYNETADRGMIGIEPNVIREQVGPIRAIQAGFVQTGHVIAMTFQGFIQIFAQRSTEGLGGPVMIASIVGQAARTGMQDVLNWLAIISINLGIINLLPFPALDGGRIVFVLIEVIAGKPVPRDKEGLIHLIGFALLILLMVFVIYQDIITSFF